MANAENEFKVIIGGPVSVYWANNDGSEDKEITELNVIKGFHNKTYMDPDSDGRTPELLSLYLHDGGDIPSLKNANISQGILKYEYIEEKEQLWILVEYSSNKKLSESELELLYEFTSGQWTDGSGQNFSGELADENNGISPLAEPNEVYFLQAP